MNVKRFALFVFGFLLLLAACATEPEIVEVTRLVTETVVVEEEVVEVTRVVGQTVVVETVVESGPITVVPAPVDADRPVPQPNIVQQPVPPADMFFESYGVNPFIDTDDDPLSTFALDVDTGSYTIMRRYLRDGLLPPAESVRVEEYINYFHQAYEPPPSGAFAIHLEGAPSPYGETDQYHLLRIGVQGYEVPPQDRSDALLIFVIDVSGSMNMENRLGLVKTSLQLLVEQLRPTDRVGIVVYGSGARVVLEPTPAAERSVLLDAIDRLHPEGATNADAGLEVAYQMAALYAIPGQINRLILCSDGVANVGQTTADAILRHAQEGISLSTFGFGLGNYNDVLMEQLADQGDGVYAYIDSLTEAFDIFVQDVTGTLQTIAKDAKIQVTFNPEAVARYRLLGYENRDVADEDFRNDWIDAGEIGAGHSATALYELKFHDDVPASETALMASVRYADPETEQVIEIANTIRRDQFAADFFAASPTFQLSAVVAEFAELLRESFWARDNSLSALTLDAMRLTENFPGDREVLEFAALVNEARLLWE